MVSGDSKVVPTGYPDQLVAALNAIPLYQQLSVDNGGHGGWTTANLAAGIAADLAARGTLNTQWVLLTISANDDIGAVGEAAWKASMVTIIDSAHAKWPAAMVGISRTWVRGHESWWSDVATWLDAIRVGREAWTFVGPDERIYLKGTDDGASETTDGKHPTTASYAVAAALWRTAMGY